MQIKTFCGSALLVLWAQGILWSQTSPALQQQIDELKQQKESVQRKIRKTEADIVKTDSLTKQEEQRFRNSEAAHRKDMERRAEEYRKQEKELQNLRAATNAAVQEEMRHKNAMENEQAKRQVIRQKLLQLAAQGEAAINAGLPWEKSRRLESVRALKKDLEAENAALPEALGRLSAIMREEIRFGDEITLLQKPVTTAGGQVINAKVLKLGNIWMAYMDEEGKRYGLMVPGKDTEKPEWKEDLDFKQREAVRIAIEVKSSKRPPEAVSLPLSVFLISRDENAKGGAK